MKNCPKCAKKYDDSWDVCLNCNLRLVDVNVRLVQLEEQAQQILKEIKEIRTGVKERPDNADQRKPATAKTEPVMGMSAQSAKQKDLSAPRPENVETHIGKYLLSKMGVVSLVAGIAFFIAYTFQYLTPLYKIALSYLISIGLLAWGMRIEKNNKFEKYGRSLIGGGWALIYFVTFAMHHIKAVRIINNQAVDLVLLAVVVGIMIAHLLKYRSQTAVALVLFLGYFTAGISNITQFTLIYIAVLAVIAAIISFKMKWHQLPLFSMLATYSTHFLWTRPQIGIKPVSGQTFWIALGFVILYWITYSALSFMIEADKQEEQDKIIASVFLNAICFGLFGGMAFQDFNPGLRFNFLFLSALVIAGAAFLARFLQTKKYLFHPYLIASIVAITAALHFKLDREWVNIIWLSEVPLLTFLGLYCNSKPYRVFGYILAAVMFVNMGILLGTNKLFMFVFGRQVSARIFTVIVGILCYYAAKLIYTRFKASKLAEEETALASIYVFSGTLYAGILSFMEISQQIISLTWAAIAFSLFVVGFMTKDRYFRYAAMVMMAATVLRVVTIDLSNLEVIYRILAFVGLGIILLAVSYFYSRISSVQDSELAKEEE